MAFFFFHKRDFFTAKGDLENAERIAKQMTRGIRKDLIARKYSSKLKNQALYEIAIRYIEKGDFQKVKDLKLFDYKVNYLFFCKRQSGPKNNEFYRDIASRLISLNQLQLAKDIANKIDDEDLKNYVISQTNKF